MKLNKITSVRTGRIYKDRYYIYEQLKDFLSNAKRYSYSHNKHHLTNIKPELILGCYISLYSQTINMSIKQIWGQKHVCRVPTSHNTLLLKIKMRQLLIDSTQLTSVASEKKKLLRNKNPRVVVGE